MVKTYKNLFTTVAPNEGTDFIAIYGTTTYNEISGALANEKTIFVKVNYDTNKYRYAPLTGQTVIDGETNYYTFTCVVINTLYTYKLSELDAWSSSSKDLEEVDINDINSGSATSGKVITANGSGGASWESIPNELPSLGTAGQVLTINSGATGIEWSNIPTELPSITNNAEKVLKVNSTATGVEWALSNSDSVFVATYGTTTYSEILAAYNAGKFIVAKYIQPSSQAGEENYLYLKFHDNHNFIFTSKKSIYIGTPENSLELKISWNSGAPTGFLYPIYDRAILVFPYIDSTYGSCLMVGGFIAGSGTKQKDINNLLYYTDKEELTFSILERENLYTNYIIFKILSYFRYDSTWYVYFYIKDLNDTYTGLWQMIVTAGSNDDTLITRYSPAQSA